MPVVIVGGGLTGLAAAYELGLAGVPTLLVEASDRLGGKVQTERIDDFLVESGPDSFVAYRPAGMQLIDELGLRDQVIHPQQPRTVHIWAGERLVPLPEGLDLILPTTLRPFLETRLFTTLQKARLGLDLVLPRNLSADDVAIGPFLRRRLGAALVDRLAGPLVGGIYGTAIDELSLGAVLPQLRQAERKHRSLLLAGLASRRAREAAARAGAPGRRSSVSSPFVSLVAGTGQLIDALVAAIGRLPSVTVRTGTPVGSLEAGSAGPELRLADGTALRPESIVLATPAPASAATLVDVAPAAARHLRSIVYGSTGVVSLAYDERDLPDVEAGHGFLVAEDADLSISAATISSRKWAGRAPAGAILIRAFLGDRSAALLDLPDDRVIDAIRADLARTIGLRAEPTLARVARWPGAMPHYTVGHLERVAAAEAAVAAVPGLILAGSAYRGVGLPDCIGQGRDAARRVVDRLGGRGEAALDDGAAGDPLSDKTARRRSAGPLGDLGAEASRAGGAAA